MTEQPMPTDPYALTIYVPDTAGDQDIEDARQSAEATWREVVAENGWQVASPPAAEFDETAAPDSGHARAWVVTGQVSKPQ